MVAPTTLVVCTWGNVLVVAPTTLGCLYVGERISGRAYHTATSFSRDKKLRRDCVVVGTATEWFSTTVLPQPLQDHKSGTKFFLESENVLSSGDHKVCPIPKKVRDYTHTNTGFIQQASSETGKLVSIHHAPAEQPAPKLWIREACFNLVPDTSSTRSVLLFLMPLPLN